MVGGKLGVRVGLELDKGSATSFKGRVESSVKPTVETKIDLDTKGLQSQVKQSVNRVSDNKIKLRVDTGTVKNEVNKIRTMFNSLKFPGEVKVGDKLPKSAERTAASVKKLKAAYRELDNAAKAYNPDDAGSVKRMTKAYDEYTFALKKAQNQLAIVKRSMADPMAKMKLTNQVDDWLQKNSRAAKHFRTEIEQLKASLRTCNSVQGLKKLNNDFRQLQHNAAKANKVGMAFGDRLRAQFGKYAAYMGSSSAFFAVTQSLRYMFNAVQDVDKAMTEL